jgi:phosphonate transport system substrate-binding protein
MRQFFVLILALFLVEFSSAADKISIGILPGGNPLVLEKESYILAEKIQNKLAKPVEIFISKNYSGLVEAIKTKKVDFAVLSAMTFVAAEKDVKMKVLLKKTWKNGPFYYSAIIVKANSKIKKLKDLKNKTIGFVDEKSTSGYMYPKTALTAAKIKDSDFKKVDFTGNHAASIERFEKGEFDAVAVFSDDENAKVGAWTRFGKSKQKIRVIWMSEPIPNDPIVVRQDFYDLHTKLTHELMYSLIEIQNENHSGLSEILGTSDLMPATARQYDPVREVYNSFQSVLKL